MKNKCCFWSVIFVWDIFNVEASFKRLWFFRNVSSICWMHFYCNFWTEHTQTHRGVDTCGLCVGRKSLTKIPISACLIFWWQTLSNFFNIVKLPILCLLKFTYLTKLVFSDFLLNLIRPSWILVSCQFHHFFPIFEQLRFPLYNGIMY